MCVLSGEGICMSDKLKKICINSTPALPGDVEGTALVSDEPLSFWGGIDPETGNIIDTRHQRCGESIKDKIFIFPNGRGSSTSSAILLECIRNGTAPAAIINSQVDQTFVLGSVVADELYGKSVPVLIVAESDFVKFKDGALLSLEPDGTIIQSEIQ